jgi:phospholipid/cholesterol/gamma-HCH transport system ATP-binding protein
MEIVGLSGAEKKLPGEISGGMRKRAGLARALVLEPQILLFDEPDSGLDPVRTAYLNQLIVDLNAQIEATFLIVTHDVNTARTVPDNIGLLYRRHLAMFGPREMLLSSNEPVVRQFINAQRQGPIGMAEEKDANELEAEKDIAIGELPPIPVQLPTSSGQLRKTQREPGSWLQEHGVLPPAGSFPGLGLDFVDGNGSSGGKAGATSRRGNVTVMEEPAPRTRRTATKTTAATKSAPAKKAAKTAAKKAAAPRKRSDGS